MAGTETIMWTPIPNGIATVGGVVSLQLSVHVAPTLSGGPTGTLSDFSDFQNWPETLANAVTNDSFEMLLTFTEGSDTYDYGATIDTSVLNAGLWSALFSPPGNVEYTDRDPGEPYTDVPIVSYPSDVVVGLLRDAYTKLITASPTSPPSLSTLGRTYDPLGYGSEDALVGLKSLWDTLSAERLNAPAAYANDWTGVSAESAMAALRFYHMPPSRLAALTLPSLPSVDFHRALTFIGQHRALQRALGLVLDVTVPLSQIETGIPAFRGTTTQSDVYVSGVAGSSASTALVTFGTPVTPRVRCNANGNGSPQVFEAYPTSSQIYGRQLTLADTNSFAFYEIDVDGAGLKNAQFADNLAIGQAPQNAGGAGGQGAAPDMPSSQAPPSLRSAGVSVAVVNRGLKFVATLQRNASLMGGVDSASPAYLTAEDLVRGYVLDVYGSSDPNWRSTAKRDVSYQVTGTTITATDEPGIESPPRSQTDPTNTSQKQLNLPANLLRWTGWSTSAPRPGSPLAADGSSAVITTGPGSGPFDQLTITATPHPGSLPRLRFGEAYVFRARIVDVAGNVLDPSEAATLNDPHQRVTLPGIYGRFEPIGSPDLYTWHQPVLGESLTHLVIRDIDSSPSSVRAIAPSRIAEAFAELHGVFDTASGGGPDGGSTTYQLIAGREGTRYPLSSTTTSSGSPLWDAISLTGAVPYLPDPLARGGTLHVTTGPLSGATHKVDFSPASGRKWPDYRPFGIRLVPGASQAISVDTGKRELSFALAKGDTVQAKLSSYVNKADLDMLGVYVWIYEFYGGSVPSAFDTDATDGLVWALTPYTMIELIHAVRIPLKVPELKPIAPHRAVGWTYAELVGALVYSPKSTARTELLASWVEPVDGGPGTAIPQGPGSPHDKQVPRSSTVFTIPSSLAQQDTAVEEFSGRHEFFDHKHRFVNYRGRATSAFTEHYQGKKKLKVPNPGTPTGRLELPGKGNLGLEPGSVLITRGSTVYLENVAFTVNRSAATITFKAPPAGPPHGSTVEVEFLPAVSVDSAEHRLNILSSARPLSPEVEFVVPIYKWSKVEQSHAKVHSGRSPSALRVFMSRPWWSSGVGELLGVTTFPRAETPFFTDAIAAPDHLYVSDWGLDPVFRGGRLPSPHPRLESFPRRAHDGKELTIDENASVLVNVAGHDVLYDESRGLWYSDIEVDIGKAYTPMIRLALARYQPDSVHGVELSRIVLADVMSLEPGRQVVVVRKNHRLLQSVTLAGYSYRNDGDVGGNGPGVATLVVERRDPSIHDPTLGWAPVGKPITMRSHTDKAGVTFWQAQHVKLPSSGKLRLWIGQFEAVPDDRPPTGTYLSYHHSEGLRLLYQDIIPL